MSAAVIEASERISEVHIEGLVRVLDCEVEELAVLLGCRLARFLTHMFCHALSCLHKKQTPLGPFENSQALS